MKRTINTLTIAFAAIAASFSFQACNQIKDATPAQDIPFTAASVIITIPPTSDTSQEATFGQTTFTYNFDSLIKDKTKGFPVTLGFDNVQSINITSIAFTLTNPDNSDNFANFSIVGAAFNTDANGGSYGPYNIAEIENNPDTYNTFLNPAVDTQDVKKYFSKTTTLNYFLVGKLRRATTIPLTCQVDVTYNIVVK